MAMNIINRILLTYWHSLLKEIDLYREAPIRVQRDTLSSLIKGGKGSSFGQEHNFGTIRDYESFRKSVPIRDYNGLSGYIERIRGGEKYVLWNQEVPWYAKSSGTSAQKSKFIPITPINLKECHYKGFQMLLASYINTHRDSKLFYGKSLTLGGSVKPEGDGSISYYTGDLSAVLLQNSPKIVEAVRVPSKSTALVHDFEEKNLRICQECSKANVTNFSGVPSWNLIMIEKLLEYNNAEYLTDIWPNVELFMHGGISFEPYREQYHKIIPSPGMNYLENYNASEGYFAFQDDLSDHGMLLTLGNGVFYEFVEMDHLQSLLDGEYDKAIPLEEVKPGVQYAIIISTNSGLWRYMIGDCVKFTSTDPYKIIITGRTQQYINAFGEELMIENAEKALAATCRKLGIAVKEYTVAPIFMEEHTRGGHQWVVEFEGDNGIDYDKFAEVLDSCLCDINSDYEAKRRESHTMERLTLTPVPQGTFYRWMASRGKIGGQNKVPRLSSNRQHIESILSGISLGD